MAYKNTLNGAGDTTLAASLEPLCKSVLGCILIDPNKAVYANVIPAMFFKWEKVAAKVFKTIQDEGTIDTQALAVTLEREGTCRTQDFWSLFGAANQARFEQHVAKVKQEWLRIREISLLEECIQRLKAGVPVEAVDRYSEEQREILHGFTHDKNQDRRDMSQGFLDHLHDIQTGNVPVGYLTDIHALDKLTGGFGIPNRYRVIPARTGMGKSTLLYQSCISLAKKGCGVALFSLETMFYQMMETFCQQETGIARDKMQKENGLGDEEIKEIHKVVGNIHDLPFYVEDNSDELGQILNKARLYIRKYGVKVIFIDYLQLIQDRSGTYKANRERELEIISRSLVLLALKEKVDVTVFTQLSREVEKKADKIPELSHIRGSGSIEQDGGQILFIFRPDYYGFYEDSNGDSQVGAVDLIQRKDRYSGRIGTNRMWYNPIYNKYQNERFDYQGAVVATTGGTYEEKVAKAQKDDIPF